MGPAANPEAITRQSTDIFNQIEEPSVLLSCPEKEQWNSYLQQHDRYADIALRRCHNKQTKTLRVIKKTKTKTELQGFKGLNLPTP